MATGDPICTVCGGYVSHHRWPCPLNTSEAVELKARIAALESQLAAADKALEAWEGVDRIHCGAILYQMPGSVLMTARRLTADYRRLKS